MPKIDEAAILKRARTLAEQDGFEWELNFEPVNPGAKLKAVPFLTDERRQQYMARARGQLAGGS